MSGDWALAITAIITLIGGLTLVVYRFIRDDQITKAFVKSMAVNHLPHIYACQTAIAEQVGAALPPDPPIEFVDLEKKD